MIQKGSVPPHATVSKQIVSKVTIAGGYGCKVGRLHEEIGSLVIVESGRAQEPGTVCKYSAANCVTYMTKIVSEQESCQCQELGGHSYKCLFARGRMELGYFDQRVRDVACKLLIYR